MQVAKPYTLCSRIEGCSKRSNGLNSTVYNFVLWNGSDFQRIYKVSKIAICFVNKKMIRSPKGKDLALWHGD